MVSLKLLGGASVSDDAGPLTGPVAQRHRLALLALLAMSPGEAVPRERLAALLWPESNADRARNSLKQAVHAIRRALGPDSIVSAGDELRLNPSIVSCDAVAFLAAIDAGDPARAVDLWSGAFLDGFFLSNAREFEEWVDSVRARLHATFIAALETLATRAEAAGDPAASVPWWRRLAAESPGNSRNSLRLMQALAATGDRAAAIRHGQVHTTLLREEFGAQPDAEVLALMDHLRAQPPQPAPARVRVPDMSLQPVQSRTSEFAREPDTSSHSAQSPRPAPEPARVPDPMARQPGMPARTPRRRMRLALAAIAALIVIPVTVVSLRAWTANANRDPGLVVLPFMDMGSNAGDAYFTDGMTEELIHALSQIAGLRVIARTSAFQFKGTNIDVREVGDDLDVDYVLEGSVRRSGDRLRITAQLVNTSDGSHLWSDTYDRPLDDMIAVQEDIARAIAGELRLRLTLEAPVAGRHSEDREAYLLYLKGLHALNQHTPASARQAIAYLEQAIARDPDYALAHASIAHAHVSLIDLAGVHPEVATAHARAAALRALEKDSTLAAAHAILGLIYTEDWQWEEARRAFARAFELDAGEPYTYLWYSLYLDNMGRFDEALVTTQRAQQLDPLSASASYNVTGTFLHLARFDEAITEARRMVELHPTLAAGYDALGWALVDAGRPAEAIEPLERAVAMAGGRWLALANLGRAYAFVGRHDDARAIIARLERDWGRLGFGNFAMAAVHLALDERDAALARLELVYRLRYAKLPHVRQWTAFEPLYGDPDFSRIVSEAGFEPPSAVPD
ncbi:MAG TPA: BTAD domain-containing putative transcriptional regulator [Longimicrobiales bacterium]|nr:BTAD domain-containing putative transcriptional regulator [Longimicrobiales bacterium]